MIAGTATVANDESVAGEGMALAIYTANAASMTVNNVLPAVPTLGDTTAPWSTARPVSAQDVTDYQKARLRGLREVARAATAYAVGIVSYVQATAVAVIKADATGDGLQAGTTHPTADKLITIK